MQETICRAVRAGAPYSLAATMAGIAERTLYDWIARGEGRSDRRTTPAHRAFVQALKSAELERTLEALERVRAGDKGWQSGAWFLERRYPHLFARRTAETAEQAAKVGPTPEEQAEMRYAVLGERGPDKGKQAFDSFMKQLARLAPKQPNGVDQPAPPVEPPPGSNGTRPQA